MKGKLLKINVNREEDYRVVQTFFRENKIQYKAFLLEEDKPVKIVLRVLPVNTKIDLIKLPLGIHQGFSENITVTKCKGIPLRTKYLYLYF